MNDSPVVIFVCEHGAAKSIVAAAYFNKLVQDRKIKVRAIARGTHPDKEISKAANDGLIRDGLKPGEQEPRLLSRSEAANAISLITFCPLPNEFLSMPFVEDWSDIPPVSEDYDRSRDAMLDRIRRFLESL
jgi:arsenate reductase (thioredoxin)